MVKRICLLIISTLVVTQLFAQSNIAEVRNYNEGEEVTVTGIVTNGDEFGIIRYLQDATGGLAAYGEKVSSLKRGDSITISGTLKSYRNLLEIEPINSVTVHSSGHELPAPNVLSIDDIGEDYEGQLIQINSVKITNANGTFAGGTNYEFTANGKSSELRINGGTSIVGEVIPSEEFNLVAICSQFSFYENDTRNGYQLLPRDMHDFIFTSPLNIISPLIVTNIQKNSLTLTWNTDEEANAMVRYGNSPNAEDLDKMVTATTTADITGFKNMVEITNLKVSEIIHAQAISILENDTVISSIVPFATQSNSTGEIRVYFNTPVDESVADITVAKNIGKAMEDTLIAYINRAQETIDFCVYNFNNSGLSDVAEALNNAYNRGIEVRFITSGSTAHLGTDDLNPNIEVLESPYSEGDGIMHNKFAIFDANSADPNTPWVWTGSLNISYNQVNTDAQNILFIQDQTLAKVYKIEFEEMWGSSGLTPNTNNSKFGALKTDNTPHDFIIGSTTVACYFSPSDNTNQKIIDAINSADNDLNVETMLITRSDLALAIKDAYFRGAEVHVINNYINDNSETVNNILSELPDGNFVFDDTADGILHHKFAIVDANFAASDPLVITGSHNWSNSANDRNDENTLIIHNADIANQYFQQFAYRFAENGGNLYVSAEITENKNLHAYPNPASRLINISSQEIITKVQLYNVAGILCYEKFPINKNRHHFNIQQFQKGLYLLKVETGSAKIEVYKIVKK